MATGPSTSTSPYILPSAPNVRLTSIVTVGDALPANGVFAGKPDGIGAYDNGDGTITVLLNHELTSSEGIVRDHGSRGAYVDRLVIDKATLRIISSDDLIKSVRQWNDATDSYFTGTTAFSKFCSSDLAVQSAFFNSATGSGTGVRIYLTGEESSPNGRAFATLVTGPNAGIAYELPYLGNMAFENVVANPLAQQQTIVALTDDSGGGEVYFYIGQKQSSGTDIQKAGLTNGDLYGLRVVGIANEADGSPANGAFRLQEIGPGGDVSNMSGAQIETESGAEGVTSFLRPEDCAWDPDNPNVLYFTTTSSTRLYQATFTDIRNPLLGGTITAVLDGSEGQRDIDNITVAAGKVILQEDPGTSSALAKIWQYDIASDALNQLAAFDPARFTSGGSDFITTAEESSGVLDVTALLGDSDTRAYLLGAMVHSSTGSSATVERGQLMVMYVDSAPATGTTVTFSNGGTYSGTVDTSIDPFSPGTSEGSATTLYIDSGSQLAQTLLAFNNLFGSGAGQIPFGATITSATLTLNTVNASAAGASLHRMVTSWGESSTWNSLGNGVQLGTEAVSSADLSTGAVGTGVGSFNVTASLNAWLSGASSAAAANAANKGWVFIANSNDGWDFSSSEGATRPTLTVTYTTAPSNMVIFRDGGTYSGTRDTSISPNSPDTSAASATTLAVDRGTDTDQTLLAFNDLFGSGAGQIPFGATITSATLTLNTVNASAGGASLHRMVTSWGESSTWNSLGNGIQLGTEAVSNADLSTGAVGAGVGSFNVTASLNAWLSGASSAAAANAANKGWVFIANSSDGWDFSSSEGATRPTLTVTYEMNNISSSIATPLATGGDTFVFSPAVESSGVDPIDFMSDLAGDGWGRFADMSGPPFRSGPWEMQRAAAIFNSDADMSLGIPTLPMTQGDYFF